MSTGDVRRSQLSITFSTIKKYGETSSQRSNKRLRKDLENATPKIVINQSSTATITEDIIKYD